MNEAMVLSTKVIRLRFGSNQDGGLMDQVRALVMKWSEIEHAVLDHDDARLVTVTNAGSRVRVTTADEIVGILAERHS